MSFRGRVWCVPTPTPHPQQLLTACVSLGWGGEESHSCWEFKKATSCPEDSIPQHVLNAILGISSVVLCDTGSYCCFKICMTTELGVHPPNCVPVTLVCLGSRSVGLSTVYSPKSQRQQFLIIKWRRWVGDAGLKSEKLQEVQQPTTNL